MKSFLFAKKKAKKSSTMIHKKTRPYSQQWNMTMAFSSNQSSTSIIHGTSKIYQNTHQIVKGSNVPKVKIIVQNFELRSLPLISVEIYTRNLEVDLDKLNVKPKCRS